MKNKNIIWGLLALFCLTSCDRFLDEIPDSRIEVDTPKK